MSLDEDMGHTDDSPLSSLLLLLGIWAQIQMPQPNMDVIQGQMVVLRATYNAQTGSDLSTNVVLWNFITDNTQQVRTQQRVI